MALTASPLVRRALLVLVALVAVAQFVPVGRSNPPTDPRLSLIATARPPAPVAAALERSCHDCHSNQTRWPWYSRVAPVSWLVARDVSEGRAHLNFSEWSALDTRRRSRRLEEICEMVNSGEMPLGIYLMLHPDARLTPQDVTAICDWTRAEAAGSPGAPPAR